MKTESLRNRLSSQRGINMVDLMMWLVIAALLLAAAIQGIGFYQHRAYIHQMSSDVRGAGQNALARVSMDSGKLTEADIRSAVSETQTTGEVQLASTSLGRGFYAIEATHPAVTDYRIIYAFDDRNDLKTGINLTKMSSVNIGDASSAGDQCANEEWWVQYYTEYQEKGVATVSPVLSRCETAPISYFWNDGGPNVPGMPTDKFAIHWTKNFEVATSQNYEFTITSDNQSRVYLDGREILDNSRWYGSTTIMKVTLPVSAGKHNVTIRYSEHGGGASIKYTQDPVG